MKKEPQIYCTTYCNHGHYVKTGKPVNHECYTLPPKGLRLESEGKYDEALEVFQEWARKRRG